MITRCDIDNLPESTGVYIFCKKNKPLYIGKAINIRARVKSHVANVSFIAKEHAIVSQSDNVKTILTNSEFNALLLEAQLIKKHKPRYNTIWKDDKNYIYIKINKNLLFPSVTMVRRENEKNCLYFGPYQNKRILLNLLRDIRKIIPFSTHEKIPKKPCFYHKLGLCSPCPAEINLNNKIQLLQKYKNNLSNLINLLKGKAHLLENLYETQMKKTSEKGLYEKSIILRNKLFMLRKLIYSTTFSKEIGITNYQIQNFSLDPGILKKFYPTISTLNKIECIDASVFHKDSPVGSMVVFVKGYPSPKLYKRFKIKNLRAQSDVDYIKEIIERRLKRSEWSYPDLLVIDGGKPQLKAVRHIFNNKKTSIPLIGIAKRVDRIIIGFDPYKTIYLSANDPLFNLLKYVRDESHRFAKKYHIFLRNPFRT